MHRRTRYTRLHIQMFTPDTCQQDAVCVCLFLHFPFPCLLSCSFLYAHLYSFSLFTPLFITHFLSWTLVTFPPLFSPPLFFLLLSLTLVALFFSPCMLHSTLPAIKLNSMKVKRHKTNGVIMQTAGTSWGYSYENVCRSHEDNVATKLSQFVQLDMCSSLY